MTTGDKPMSDVDSLEAGLRAIIKSRSAAKRAMQLVIEDTERNNPGLTPGEAHGLALASEEGQVIAKLYRELPQESLEMKKRAQPINPNAEEAERLQPTRPPEGESYTMRKARGDFRDLVAQVQRERPGISPSDAWDEAHRRDPDLYAKAKGGS